MRRQRGWYHAETAGDATDDCEGEVDKSDLQYERAHGGHPRLWLSSSSRPADARPVIRVELVLHPLDLVLQAQTCQLKGLSANTTPLVTCLEADAVLFRGRAGRRCAVGRVPPLRRQGCRALWHELWTSSECPKSKLLSHKRGRGGADGRSEADTPQRASTSRRSSRPLPSLGLGVLVRLEILSLDLSSRSRPSARVVLP